MGVIWRKAMSVGNTAVDDDHRYLVCLSNTIELALTSPPNRDILVPAVDALIDYTVEHFAREEALQRKVGYPKLDEHRAEHRRIVGEVKALREQLGALVCEHGEQLGDAQIAELGNLQHLSGLIRRWVLDHILVRDREMKPYFDRHPAALR